MRTLDVRNVHEALPHALYLLRQDGVKRNSRNGPVLVYPEPVTTVYHAPKERVIFHSLRDANPFFHLYESLWMLQGRNDVKPLLRYAKQIGEYSDDQLMLYGAYGYRWRKRFGMDQLAIIANRLIKDHDDRRCVLQMWDCRYDLDHKGKDVPCNDTATFQINSDGHLDLVVFCRSNDIIWGCYGANAVHFSILLEYMALWIGVPIGTYTQISVNWHAYTKTMEPLLELTELTEFSGYRQSEPYRTVYPYPLYSGSVQEFDTAINELLMHENTQFQLPRKHTHEEPFIDICYLMFLAHFVWRTEIGMERYSRALDVLALGDQRCDWIRAGIEWIERRQRKFLANRATFDGGETVASI